MWFTSVSSGQHHIFAYKIIKVSISPDKQETWERANIFSYLYNFILKHSKKKNKTLDSIKINTFKTNSNYFFVIPFFLCYNFIKLISYFCSNSTMYHGVIHEFLVYINDFIVYPIHFSSLLLFYCYHTRIFLLFITFYITWWCTAPPSRLNLFRVFFFND